MMHGSTKLKPDRVCADAINKLISVYFSDFYNTISTWGLLNQQDVLADRELVPVTFIKSGTRSIPLEDNDIHIRHNQGLRLPRFSNMTS
jgi:hypothetical protein